MAWQIRVISGRRCEGRSFKNGIDWRLACPRRSRCWPLNVGEGNLPPGCPRMALFRLLGASFGHAMGKFASEFYRGTPFRVPSAYSIEARSLKYGTGRQNTAFPLTNSGE